MNSEIKNLFSEISCQLEEADARLAANEAADLTDLDKKVADVVEKIKAVEDTDKSKYLDELRRVSEKTREIRDKLFRHMESLKESISEMSIRQKAGKSYSKAANDN